MFSVSLHLRGEGDQPGPVVPVHSVLSALTAPGPHGDTVILYRYRRALQPSGTWGVVRYSERYEGVVRLETHDQNRAIVVPVGSLGTLRARFGELGVLGRLQDGSGGQ